MFLFLLGLFLLLFLVVDSLWILLNLRKKKEIASLETDFLDLKKLKPWQIICNYLIVPIKTYPMNINITGFNLILDVDLLQK